jgi:hypothetical protein
MIGMNLNVCGAGRVLQIGLAFDAHFTKTVTDFNRKTPRFSVELNSYF